MTQKFATKVSRLPSNPLKKRNFFTANKKQYTVAYKKHILHTVFTNGIPWYFINQAYYLQFTNVSLCVGRSKGYN